MTFSGSTHVLLSLIDISIFTAQFSFASAHFQFEVSRQEIAVILGSVGIYSGCSVIAILLVG